MPGVPGTLVQFHAMLKALARRSRSGRKLVQALSVEYDNCRSSTKLLINAARSNRLRTSVEVDGRLFTQFRRWSTALSDADSAGRASAAATRTLAETRLRPRGEMR